MTASDTHRTIEAIWRIESARVIAGLTRVVRDVGVAEELAQDALLTALSQWPQEGIPNNPAAWLMRAGKNRAIDRVRRNAMAARKHESIAHDLEIDQQLAIPDMEAEIDDDVGDDILRLIFISCHPILQTESQVALTLRLMGGLTTDEIARAFLISEATVSQRIVRAKRRLAESGVPFELPRGEDRAERLSAVLSVLYLIFNEGYSATAGEDWMRPTLCEEAMRLGRSLAALMPDEPEVLGLIALMELQASRFNARIDRNGAAIPLAKQNRARWDQMMIRRGLAALARAEELAGGLRLHGIQAAIAACHARAVTVEDTDWHRISALYRALNIVSPSPVVELNRAVALAQAEGPAAGLEIVEALGADGTLARYHLLPAVRGDLLEKLGRREEARSAFEEAANLARNARERAVLMDRAVAAGTTDA